MRVDCHVWLLQMDHLRILKSLLTTSLQPCLSTAIAKSHKDRYMNHDHAYPATQPARPSVVRITKRQRWYNQELNRAKRWHPSNKADGRKHLRAVKVRR
jgi:hypothetical protein